MNFDFPPDTLMLRDMLRRFVQKEARPLESKFFTSGELTSEERARLRQAIEQLGLWGLMVPADYGGGGLDLVTSCMVEEELGKTFVPVETGDISPLLYACKNEQVSQYLEPALEGKRRAFLAVRESSPKPGNLPGLLMPKEWKTSVREVKGEYIINGNKILTGHPAPQDFLIILVNMSEGPTAFLLDASNPSLSLSTDEELILCLRDCHVGCDSILGEPGGSLVFDAVPVRWSWIKMGARIVGVVERLIEMAVDHVNNWESLGAVLAVRPAIQRLITDMRVEVECARLLVYYAAWMEDECRDGALQRLAAEARLATIEMLQHSVDRLTLIYTGPGPSPQIEPYRFVQGIVPAEALDLALERSRAILISEMFDLSQG